MCLCAAHPRSKDMHVRLTGDSKYLHIFLFACVSPVVDWQPV